MSSSCKTCDNQDSIVNTMSETVQKKIQKQTNVHQSLYLLNKSSLNNTINNNNEGKKYNSYDRYLLKKKGKVLSQHGKVISTNPKQGNKTKSLSITSLNKNCNFCN